MTVHDDDWDDDDDGDDDENDDDDNNDNNAGDDDGDANKTCDAGKQSNFSPLAASISNWHLLGVIVMMMIMIITMIRIIIMSFGDDSGFSVGHVFVLVF